MKAILLVSHGSRLSQTKEEVAWLVEILRNRIKDAIVEFAFLELEHPRIPEGIDICALKGAKDIVLLLNFLNAGRHVGKDIPAIVREAKKKYHSINFTVTKPVGQHVQIADLLIDLINTPVIRA